MPKRISEEIWEEIKAKYLRDNAKPKELSALFGVSVRSIEQRAANESWANQRKARALIAVGVSPDRAAVAAATAAGESGESVFATMSRAIGLLAAEAETIPGKSKEGCYNAMTNMIKAHRELFPPDAEGLAKIAADLGIRPADFIRALQKEWNDRDAQAS